MARKISAATDWKPIDIFEEGAKILRSLPENVVRDQLFSSLPNHDLLEPDGRQAAWSAVSTALIFFVKARREQAGFPHAATVRQHLNGLSSKLRATIDAFEALDLRTKNLVWRVAGTREVRPGDYNNMALNESPLPGGPADRGRDRVRLLVRALKDSLSWVEEAHRQRPKRDPRSRAEPGLEGFVSDIAHVWENYGGIRFTASRNRDGAPDFILGLLNAAGFDVTRALVLAAAQAVVTKLERERPDRIIVPPEDRNKPLRELLQRAREKRIVTRGRRK
jgi:hypothetical protein